MRNHWVMLRHSAIIFVVMLLVLTLHSLLLSFLGGGGWKEPSLIWHSLQAAQVALLVFILERELKDDQAAQDDQPGKSIGKP